jgi:hypothetical protein
MSYSDVVNGVVVGHSSSLVKPAKTPKGVWMLDRFVNTSYNPITEYREGPAFSILGGEAGYTYTIVPHPQAASNLTKDLKAKLGEEYSRLSKVLTSNYPDEVVKTWYQQKDEVVTFRADPTTPTPMLDAMEAKSGKTKEELAVSIETNVSLFASAVGNLLGRFQAVKDSIALAGVDLVELVRVEDEEIYTGW